MSGDLVLTDRAALALIDDAERALAAVTDPEDADDLWRKIKAVEEAARLARVSEAIIVPMARVRLRARRRYGELLGPAEKGAPKANTNAAQNNVTARDVESVPVDRMAVNRARKLADVPEEVFTAHLEAEKLDDLSEAALLREAKRATAPPPPPPSAPAEGTYSVVYVDPPWRYDHISTPSMRAVENHYPTMTAADLAALHVPAAQDAVLFMWATSPKLAEALALIEAWGFTYRTCAVWVKDRQGMGYYVRAQHELLLIAKRGDMRPPAEANRPPSVVTAPRGAHSAKPHEVYDLIERMYPDHSRVEMFARGQRAGWASWGNQLAGAA
jgi:N6-adenosine-specific RNA methylase IME4